VEGIAVDLDDDVVPAPEEVDLVAGELDVGLGLGQARRSDQLEQTSFRLGSRERRVRLDRVPQRSRSFVVGVAPELLIEGMVCDEAVDPGLVSRPVEVSLGEPGAQVEESAGGVTGTLRWRARSLGWRWLRWRRMPGRSRALRPGTVTSIVASRGGRRPQRTAAGYWLSSASSPAASTAAIA
jgi:hypothetical protein